MFTYEDKFIHMGMHGTLAFIFMRDLYLVNFYDWTKKQVAIRIFLYSLLLGCIIEVLQAFMAMGRYFDPFDVMANCVGVSVGIWISMKVFMPKFR